jgi:hypothetical protein
VLGMGRSAPATISVRSSGSRTAGMKPFSAAAHAHSGQSATRTAEWIHERPHVSAESRPRMKSSRRASARVQPSWASRRAVNGERITAALPLWRMPKSEAAEPITLASSSKPPVTLITVSARITVAVL